MENKRNKSVGWLWRIAFIVGLFVVSIWSVERRVEIPDGEISLTQLISDSQSRLIKKITIYEGTHIIALYHDGSVQESFLEPNVNVRDLLGVDNDTDALFEFVVFDISYNSSLLFLTILTLLPCTAVSLFWSIMALIPSKTK